MTQHPDCWNHMAERSPLPAALTPCGDLICPLCEEPLDLKTYSEGFCARCAATVEIG